MWWIAVVLALLVAAPARAATVGTLVEDSGDQRSGPLRFVTWTIADRAGEANAMTVRAVRGGIEVRDVRPLRAGRACRRVSARRVRCLAPRPRRGPLLTSLAVRLGAGDDRLTLRHGFFFQPTVWAQAGDDIVDASTAAPEMSGLVLYGGAGNDRLTAGPADDTLQGDSGTDVLDGGAGSDTARFPRGGAVHASLVTGTAASAGAIDALAGVENVVAGRGDDVLEGDAGPNRLSGGRGADRLTGGDGDDVLSGDHEEGAREQAASPDRLDGGAGRDELTGHGGGDVYAAGDGDDVLRPGGAAGAAETVECGAGADQVRVPDGDVVEATCEQVGFHAYGPSGEPSFTVPPAIAGPGWAVDGVLRCETYSEMRCDATVVLADAADPQRVLGSLEAAVALGEERPFTLELSPEGREELRRRGALLARLTITTPYLMTSEARFSAVLRLRGG